jgi:autotransporter translocation and assembly factor TamB
MKALRIPMRVLLLLFLVLVISGGFLYWVGTRTGILEQQVNAWLDSFLSAQLPLAVTIDDIGGESWHHLLITGIQIDEISGDSLIPLLVIDSLDVQYNWRNLISRTWIIQKASVAGVRGRIRTDSLGQPQFVWHTPDRNSNQKITLPEIEIEELHVRRVELVKTGVDTVRLLLDRAAGTLQMLPGRFDQQLSLTDLEIQGPRSVRIDSAHAHVLVMDREWFVNDVFLHTDSTTLEGFARIATDSAMEVFANVSISPGRWNDVSKWAHVNLPGSGHLELEAKYSSGVLSGRGTIRGDLFGRQLEGLGWALTYQDDALVFDTLFGRALGSKLNGSAYLDLKARPLEYGATVTASGFNLQALVDGEFSSDLSGDFIIAGRGTRSSTVRVQINTPGARGWLNQIFVDSLAGEILATSQAIDIQDNFKASYLGMDATLGGHVAFSGDMEVRGTVIMPQITRVTEFLGYPGMKGTARGPFSLSSTSIDPTLNFDLQVSDLKYKNANAPRAHVTSRLIHAFTAAQGVFEGQITESDLWGVSVDSGDVQIQIAPTTITADGIHVYRGPDHIDLAAQFVPESGALTVSRCDALILDRPFSLEWPAELGIIHDTLWIHNIPIQQGEGAITVNGWINYEGALKIETTIGNAAIGRWTALASRADEFDGTLFANVEVTGHLDAPHADYEMRLIDFTYGQFVLGVFTARGSLSTDELLIDSIALQTGVEEYFGHAYLPLTYYDQDWHVDRDDDLDAELSLTGTGMRLIRLLLPDVESLSGDVHGTAQITGSLDNPTIVGQFDLREGNLKVWQLRDPLSALSVSVDFHDSVATVVNITADVHNVDDSKQSGNITGNGTMTFRDLSSLDYDISLNGVDVPGRYEFGDFTGRFDFDVALTGTAPPVVQGDVRVREAYYRDPFEMEDSLAWAAAETRIDTIAWNINLDVNIPKNAWTKNSDVDAEWSGNLRVLRERGRWNYLGRLEPLRGSYTFVGRRFRNLRGDIVFDDIHQVDPQLNLEADINLPYSGSQDGTIQSSSLQEITVRVTGRLSNPQVIPPAWLGEHNLIQALTVGGAHNGNSLDVGESAKQGATGFLAGQLEIAGGKALQKLGVETFELRPSSTGSYDPLDARLRIGKYLHPDIYVYGSSRVDLDLTKGTEVGFEYRLRNWLSLQGNRDFENLYNFDLNLNLNMSK